MIVVEIREVPCHEFIEVSCDDKCLLMTDEGLYSFLHDLASTDGEGVQVFWKSYDPENSLYIERFVRKE